MKCAICKATPSIYLGFFTFPAKKKNKFTDFCSLCVNEYREIFYGDIVDCPCSDCYFLDRELGDLQGYPLRKEKSSSLEPPEWGPSSTLGGYYTSTGSLPEWLSKKMSENFTEKPPTDEPKNQLEGPNGIPENQ